MFCSSITTPQDAHKGLQVAEWLTASQYQCSHQKLTCFSLSVAHIHTSHSLLTTI